TASKMVTGCEGWGSRENRRDALRAFCLFLPSGGPAPDVPDRHVLVLHIDVVEHGQRRLEYDPCDSAPGFAECKRVLLQGGVDRLGRSGEGSAVGGVVPQVRQLALRRR